MKKHYLPVAVVAIIAIVIASFAFPVLYAQSSQSSREDVKEAEAVSFSGEVTYWIHAGKAGRIYPTNTTSTTLREISTVMRVVIRPATTVKVEVKLSIELAVTADVAVGVLAVIGGLPMYPNVGGPGSSYLAGYVAHPRVGVIGAFDKLESWTFDWERIVSNGTYTIRFYWAVSSSTGRVWGDFYAVSVWATKTVP